MSEEQTATKKGIAPVKPEFLKSSKQDVEILDDEATGPKRGEKRSAPKSDSEPASKKKSRDRHSKAARAALCLQVGAGKECSHNPCKFSHDIKAFLETKPEDISPICPFFERYGSCPYGFCCRFGSKHIDKAEAKLLVDEEKLKREVAPHEHFNELNVAPQDLFKKIHSKKLKSVSFNSCIDEAKKRLGIFDTAPTPKTGAPSAKSGEDECGDEEPEACCEVPAVAEAATSETPSVQTTTTTTATMSSFSDQQTAMEAALPEPTKVEETKVENSEEKQPISAPTSEQISADSAPSAPAVNGGVSEDDAITEMLKGVESDMQKEKREEVMAYVETIYRPQEKKKIRFDGQLVLAPLTTVGNLPFRRLCVDLGVDVTVGEMALAGNLISGQASEWALLKRHPCERVFGAQIATNSARQAAECGELIMRSGLSDFDFIDLNCGCPIDIITRKGMGSALVDHPRKMATIVGALDAAVQFPVTVKVRTGKDEAAPTVHRAIPLLHKAGACAVTIHGRSRLQRYSRDANWTYVEQCAKVAPSGLQVIGNGDVFSYEDAVAHRTGRGLSGLMIGRGALIKPWLFTEIKEERHWDISAQERFDLIKGFVDYGLMHWGSDQRGVDTTRRFLLEWLSFTCRYIPVGLLEVVPQRMGDRPPAYIGRNDLETLLSSPIAEDWVKISEMLLGPVPEGFHFTPKHRSNSYNG